MASFVCRARRQASLEYHKPGITAKLVGWLKLYKTSDGKGANSLTSERPTSRADALEIIDACHQRWVRLQSGLAGSDHGFYLGA